MKRIIAGLVIGATALGGWACDSGKTEPKKQASAAAKKPEGTPLLMGDKSKKPGDAKSAGNSPAPPVGIEPKGAPQATPVAAVPLDDSSAEGAMKTYMERLKAGDLKGASEVCATDSPGAQQLNKTAEGYAKAAADGIDPKNLAGFMVGHLMAAKWEKVSEADGKALFRVEPTGKAAVEIEVVQRDGVWRVVPPQNGLP